MEAFLLLREPLRSAKDGDMGIASSNGRVRMLWRFLGLLQLQTFHLFIDNGGCLTAVHQMYSVDDFDWVLGCNFFFETDTQVCVEAGRSFTAAMLLKKDRKRPHSKYVGVELQSSRRFTFKDILFYVFYHGFYIYLTFTKCSWMEGVKNIYIYTIRIVYNQVQNMNSSSNQTFRDSTIIVRAANIHLGQRRVSFFWDSFPVTADLGPSHHPVSQPGLGSPLPRTRR
jgi:hypothetical protein